MTKEVMNWNNNIGGKKAERIPCPDGVEGCLVAHYKVIEEQTKQEQDEPVGKFAKFNDGIWREVTVGSSGVLLYTHPKEWVGLTEDEMFDCLVKFDPVAKRLPLGFKWFAEAIEAKLKDKNI